MEQSLPDGRKYWYNMTNGQTLWEPPAEILAANANNQTVKKVSTSNADVVASWREVTNASGKKYYYNAVTKVSMWEMPPEYAEYLERIKDPATMDKPVLEQRFLTMLKEMVFLFKLLFMLMLLNRE